MSINYNVKLNTKRFSNFHSIFYIKNINYHFIKFNIFLIHLPTQLLFYLKTINCYKINTNVIYFKI